MKKLRTALMIGAASLYGYLLVREVMDIDKQSNELEQQIAAFNKEKQLAKNGININEIVDIHFEEVL